MSPTSLKKAEQCFTCYSLNKYFLIEWIKLEDKIRHQAPVCRKWERGGICNQLCKEMPLVPVMTWAENVPQRPHDFWKGIESWDDITAGLLLGGGLDRKRWSLGVWPAMVYLPGPSLLSLPPGCWEVSSCALLGGSTMLFLTKDCKHGSSETVK